MKNLFKTISPVFFYLSMAMVVFLSLSVINVKYKTALIVEAMAAEIDFSTPNGSMVLADSEIWQRALVDCACEKRFNKEYPITWSGKVIATFVSGEDIGVRRYTKNPMYNQFYVNAKGMYINDPGKDVRVEGMLIGITCAYGNTVFGECVGEVTASKITLLN